MSNSTEIVPPAATVPTVIKEESFIFILDTLSTHTAGAEYLHMLNIMKLHIKIMKYQLENENVTYECFINSVKDKPTYDFRLIWWYINSYLEPFKETQYKLQILKFCNGFLRLGNINFTPFITAFQFTTENIRDCFNLRKWLLSLLSNMKNIDTFPIEKNEIDKFCFFGDKSFYEKRKFDILKKQKYIYEVAMDIDHFPLFSLDNVSEQN